MCAFTLFFQKFSRKKVLEKYFIKYNLYNLGKQYSGGIHGVWWVILLYWLHGCWRYASPLFRVKLTHCCRWHIYAGVDYAGVVSDNGLSLYRHQAIFWTNIVILLTGLLRTRNVSELLIDISKTRIWKSSLQNKVNFISTAIRQIPISFRNKIKIPYAPVTNLFILLFKKKNLQPLKFEDRNEVELRPKYWALRSTIKRNIIPKKSHRRATGRLSRFKFWCVFFVCYCDDICDIYCTLSSEVLSI